MLFCVWFGLKTFLCSYFRFSLSFACCFLKNLIKSFKLITNFKILFLILNFRNPSSGSIQMSDTGSLDRMKAQAERRKKVYEEPNTVTGRVENTRVNPDKTIDELIATHKLEQLEEDAERKLKLFRKILMSF